MPHDWGPLDLWLTPCHPWAPVSADRPTLVTWLRRGPPVQLTDHQDTTPPPCWGLLCINGLTNTGTGPRVPPHQGVPACRPPAGGHWGCFRRLMTWSGSLDSALRTCWLAARPAGAISEARVNDYTVPPGDCRELGHISGAQPAASAWLRLGAGDGKPPVLGLSRRACPRAGCPPPAPGPPWDQHCLWHHPWDGSAHL